LGNRWRLVSGILAVVLVLGAVPAWAATWYVDGALGTDDDTHGTGSDAAAFKTIQYAINDSRVTAGDTINVAAGTYTEDVTISKQVKLIGVPDAGGALPTLVGVTLTKGASTLTLQASASYTTIENMAFVVPDITGDYKSINISVALSNITIKGCKFNASGKFIVTGRSGATAVQITSGSSNITIEDCTFESGYYVTIQGYVSSLTVENSVITNCKSGINLQGGSNLQIENTDISVIAQGADNDTYCVRFASGSGSTSNMTITGGTFTVDKNNLTATYGTYHSAIIIRAGATGTLQANKMNIEGEVVNQSSTTLDATYNYWGDPSGPSGGVADPETSRVANGTGSLVSANVRFDPWLMEEDGTPTEATYTETVPGSGTVDAEDTPEGMGDVTIGATGVHTITTAKYAENPGGTLLHGDAYYDVHLDNAAGVTSLTIAFCPATADTVIWYWDGTNWRPCSDQVFTAGSPSCVVVTITNTTSPNLADLTGLYFGLGGAGDRGDVNNDGVIDVRDVRLILQAALGLVTLTEDEQVLADVNGDGQVTRADAEALARKLIGLVD